MSHFSVAVFSKPNGKSFDELLQPYHEFESDGLVDQYVVSVSHLKEAKERYENYFIDKVEAPNGKLYDPEDKRFFKDLTLEEYKSILVEKSGVKGLTPDFNSKFCFRVWNENEKPCTKARHLPKGYKDVKINVKGLMSFKDFVISYYDYPIISASEKPDLLSKHKYGYIKIDEKGNVIEIIQRTNPNSKWDYWRIGGRFRGTLKAKKGTLGPKCWEVEENDKPCHFDSALIKDLIFDPDDYKKPFETFAVISPDGKWHQKGEGDEKSLNWDFNFKKKFIDTVDPNWTITVIDCHI